MVEVVAVLNRYTGDYLHGMGEAIFRVSQIRIMTSSTDFQWTACETWVQNYFFHASRTCSLRAFVVRGITALLEYTALPPLPS